MVDAIEEPSAAAEGGAQASLVPALTQVVHQMWEAPRSRAYNEVLGGT